MKKKIIFSTYDDISNPYYAGGGAQAINEIANRVSPVFDVRIITGNYPNAKNITVNGITYKRIGPSFVGPKVGQLFFHALLPFYVKKEKFDLWVESFTPPFSTSYMQVFTKKPVIGLVHMLASTDMERKYKLPFHLIEEHGLKTYKNFIVLTDTFKKKIQKVNDNAKIFLIPNGVEIIEPSKAKNTHNEYILYIGRLEFDQKGIDLLLEGFNSIADKTKAKLLIAGSGLAQDEKLIKDKIAEYSLQERVILTGRVSGKQKEELLKNCSLVAIPSRFETFGIVALEAMAYGKPIVGFDIDGFQWIPKDCILKVKQFNAQKLGEAMQTILHDKNLRDKMSVASLSEIKKYSWDKIGEQYKDVFTSLTK